MTRQQETIWVYYIISIHCRLLTYSFLLCANTTIAMMLASRVLLGTKTQQYLKMNSCPNPQKMEQYSTNNTNFYSALISDDEDVLLLLNISLSTYHVLRRDWSQMQGVGCYWQNMPAIIHKQHILTLDQGQQKPSLTCNKNITHGKKYKVKNITIMKSMQNL